MTEKKYTWAGWIEAFQIFEKYEPDVFAEVSAEHDVIYAGPSPDKVSDEDKARLEELDWAIDEDVNSFYNYV